MNSQHAKINLKVYYVHKNPFVNVRFKYFFELKTKLVTPQMLL